MPTREVDSVLRRTRWYVDAGQFTRALLVLMCRTEVVFNGNERGRDQDLRFTERKSSLERLGSEGREQRRHHRAALERTEDADIELGDAVRYEEDTVSLADAEIAEHVGEPVRDGRELGVTSRRCP